MRLPSKTKKNRELPRGTTLKANHQTVVQILTKDINRDKIRNFYWSIAFDSNTLTNNWYFPWPNELRNRTIQDEKPSYQNGRGEKHMMSKCDRNTNSTGSTKKHFFSSPVLHWGGEGNAVRLGVFHPIARTLTVPKLALVMVLSRPLTLDHV